MRAEVQLAPHGPRLRAAVLLAAGLLTADARAATCPAAPWPPNLDLGATEVSASIRRDPLGQVEARDWSGPEPLVIWVSIDLPDCEVGEEWERVVWAFPEPPVTLAGVVRERGTGVGLAVTLGVGGRTVRTAPDGTFALRNLVGANSVRIVEPEWELSQDSVTVEDGQRVDVEWWARPVRPAANELVARYGPDWTGGVVRTLSIERAQAIPGSLGDPLRALSNEPGLGRSPLDSGWLLVRGAEFDEVGVYLDGVRVPNVYHLGGFASVLHPEMVDEVRLWPGSFPSRYGGSLSGAVDLSTRRIDTTATRAAGGVNLVFGHAFASTRTRFGAVAVAARRSWLDGILAVALDPEAAQIAPAFWDASTRVDLRGGGSLLVVVAADDVVAPSVSSGGTLDLSQRMVQAQIRAPIGDDVDIRPYLTVNTRRLEDPAAPTQEVDEWTPGLRVEARPGPATLGFEAHRRAFHLENLDVVDAAAWLAEPYAGLSTPGPLEVWAEARGTLAVVEGDPRQPARWGIGPRGGVRWRPIDGLGLHASGGRVRATPPPTLWLGVPDGAYLPLEQSETIEAGAQLARGPWSAVVNGWGRWASGLGELELDASIDPSTGRARGIESRVAYVRGGLDLSVTWQYIRSQKREDLEEDWVPSPFETPHRLDVLALQQLPRQWAISARFRWLSGYPRVPGVVALGGDQPILVPTEAYDLLTQRTVDLGLGPDDDRLAAFHALDVRIGKRFTGRWWTLDASLDVQNAYNRRVPEPIIAGFGETRPTYGFGLPILPIFALDARWRAPTR